MTRPILITGFGPFPGRAVQSERTAGARGLRARRRPAFADVAAHRAHLRDQLRGGRSRAAEADRDAQARHRADVRACGRTPHVRIETRARNTKSILFPDVTGHRPDERAIVARRSAARAAARHSPRLLAAARPSACRHGCRAMPDRYLCNYVYWRALETASRTGTPLAQFVHIPPVARSAARDRDASSACHTRRSRAPARPFCWRCWRRSAVNLNRAVPRRHSASWRAS